MRTLPLRLSLFCLTLFLAACGGGGTGSGKTAAAPSTQNPRPAGTTGAEAQVLLLKAARAAIREDHRLSVRVLWTNTVPAHPRATGGPSLTYLRQAALARKRRGIRVKLVSERFRILSLRLDPAYTSATAIVLDPQHVQPYGRDGHPLGRPALVRDHVRLVLHRAGDAPRFVVWQVVPVQ